ncbi:MAG: hypothetical protein NZM35_07970 [Chitinophagales bacterium]|nr:hypothetical protein [Chitinophagales bacterium]MDW8419141.1 hypothetical protein [Chitinophagales bacterium]
MHFCTITTSDHYYKVFALCESLRAFSDSFTLHVLVVERDLPHLIFPQLKKYVLNDLLCSDTAAKIIHKYQRHTDRLRWSLKPVFMKHILEKENAEAVIYLDNDLYFFDDYRFLFDYFNEHTFLLTPHHYERSPHQRQNMLEANYRIGLFNAGFVGARRDAADTLQWWAECCLYRCERNPLRGLYDDQKYLDLVPVMDTDALIITHRGCNVAGWNRVVCERRQINGQTLINGRYPIVFIHFNSSTIREIEQGNDPLLTSYYERYFQVLRKYKRELRKHHIIYHEKWIDALKFKIWKLATKVGV